MDSNRPNVTVFKIFSAIFASALLASTSANIFAQESADNEGIDEIIVTGIRASLQDAINKKRNADDIRDVINAEDVGKLPDSNVAEALQRITGVQIGRTFGEGSEVSVRGISTNRIELNGQTQVGTGASRSVTTFSSLPADMFSSLEVIKTPTADEVEGGLGAIIRLNTRKPLDGGDNLYVSGKLESLYSDRAGEHAPGGSIYAKNAWSLDSGGRFGATLNLSRSERKARQDYVRLKGWAPQNTGFDLDGNGVIENMVEDPDSGQILALNDAAFAPLQTAYAANLQDRSNEAVRTTLQYQSEDGSDWTLDASLSRSVREDQRYQHTTSFNSRQLTRDFRDVTYTADQTAIAGTVGNVRANGSLDRGTGLNIQASRAPYEGTTKTFALKNERMLSDRLFMTAQLDYGNGDQINDQIYATVVWGQFNTLPFIQYDFASGNDLPTVVPHTRSADLTDDTRQDLLDPTHMKLNGILYQDQHEQNIDKSFKLDFDLDVAMGSINQLEFGMRIANRTGERYRNRGKDNQGNNDDGILAGLKFPALEEYLSGRMIVMPYGDDMFDGASGDFLRDYVAIDAGWMMTMGDEMQTIGGTVKARDNQWGFETEEDTQAIYAMANFDGVVSGGMFDGMSYSGNFGARYVRTDQWAFAYELQDSGAFVPVEEEASYKNFLPSMNLALGLTDDLQLRVAAGKAMARAAMRDIAPMTTTFFFTQSGNIGNKSLVPEKVTQFDISLEYYIPSGGLISAAFFTKSYKDAIEDGFLQRCIETRDSAEGLEVRDGGFNCSNTEGFSIITDESAPDVGLGSHIFYNLATKVNAGNSRLKGFELAYERPLDFMPYPFKNMGIDVNYTYTDSSLLQLTRTGYPVGLQDFSKNSYNAEIYYDDDKFSARLAYNYRDDYYDNLTQANAAQFQKPFASLDGKVTYKINKKWDVSLQATNITNEAKEMYQEIEERLTDYTLNDTMIRLTLQGKL
jgi:TonB-dependent receptor